MHDGSVSNPASSKRVSRYYVDANLPKKHQRAPSPPKYIPAAVASQTRFPDTFSVDGFRTAKLNASYSLRRGLTVADKPTYWDQNAELFVYFQASEGRWAICPFQECGENLLVAAQRGQTRGIAFEDVDERGTWNEFVGGVWRAVQIQILACEPTSSSASISPLTKMEPLETPTNLQTFLQEESGLQEVMCLQNQKSVQLAVRFDSPTDAATAVRFSQRLLGCRRGVSQTDALTESNLRKLREQCKKQRWSRQTADVDKNKTRLSASQEL